MIRDIVRFPDARLKTVCASARESLTEEEIQRVATDLADTMESFPGCVGIAAPQISELVRMFMIDATGNRRTRSCHGRLVLVDPVIVERTGRKAMREGCLSIPDFTANITRAEEVLVRAHTPEGEELELQCDAWEARVLLHEYDHLDGMLFFDRVESAKDVFPRRNYQ